MLLAAALMGLALIFGTIGALLAFGFGLLGAAGLFALISGGPHPATAQPAADPAPPPVPPPYVQPLAELGFVLGFVLIRNLLRKGG